MHILIAPDSFKDCLSASDVAAAIARGVRAAVDGVTCDLCPVSDGGEGFVKALEAGAGARVIAHDTCTTDPLGRTHTASWHEFSPHGDENRQAVIELASASGLELLAATERDAMRTSTRGTGTLLLAAIDAGIAQIVLGIGGSATCDAGCGIAQALGGVFYSAAGKRIEHDIAGQDLKHIDRIDLSELRQRLEGRTLRVACDVTNPLTGETGAAHVYAPQKGASPAQVLQLDAGLKHIATIWREQLGIDVEKLPGAGAAGGVGGGMVAMLGGELVPGAELVLDVLDFDAHLAQADLVITGEGCFDGQSSQGKVVSTIARRAAKAGVACIAMVGCVSGEIEAPNTYGLEAIIEIGKGLSPEDSMRRAGELLVMYAKNAVAQAGC